ncbi:MAG: gluconate 2-dehydrogenase gamma chain [Halieaceae bacterium]|jgi:gluconate 2-dehydrogenase gamma chain
MNRREFLECAALLVSGMSVSRSGLALNEEQQSYLATAPNYSSRKAAIFSASQRKLVAAMAEVIIPRSDTPGAIDADVPHFIELMVQDWLNEGERTLFLGGLKSMQASVTKQHGQPFEELGAEQQLALVEGMEEDASESSWYERGNVRRAYVSDAPFICQMKELTIWGFFTSEAGCKQVLQYNPMPMRFDGHAPRSPDDGTWVPYMFYR